MAKAHNLNVLYKQVPGATVKDISVKVLLLKEVEDLGIISRLHSRRVLRSDSVGIFRVIALGGRDVSRSGR